MAMEKILAVNIGSASKKYALFENDDEIAKFHLELEDGNFLATIKFGDKEEQRKIIDKDYKASLEYMVDFLKDQKIINDENDIARIGIRIVAPGKYFQEHKVLNKNYLKNFEKVKKQAPLHIEPTLKEIKKIFKIFKKAEVFGISDSAFHKNMPKLSGIYALPEDIVEKYGIFRYGYHGISAQAVLDKIKKMLRIFPSNIIICHLGSGSSIHAIKDGKSFDTSMGFTPLEGLPMSSRIGNIDAGAVLYLANEIGNKKLDLFLNNKCGLTGISGKTGDIRELLELESRGDKQAGLALESFIYNIKKYIGAYAAAMNGLDLIVFTATIGERSFILRSRICENLDFLGVKIDNNKNNNCAGEDALICAEGSKIKVAVIKTDEMSIIQKQVLSI